jgi:hypothetical protein
MFKKITLSIVFISGIFAFSLSMAADEYSNWVQTLNIPKEATDLFQKTGLEKKYDFSFHINPFYLRGDFDGDNDPDIALLIKEKAKNRIGIAIIHHRSNKIFILGAGNSIGGGGDNFEWMTNWMVKRKGKVEQGVEESLPPALKGEALYVEKAESASGLIYWTGEKYSWYQQGD